MPEKDDEIAAGNAKIKAQSQVINDQARVIAAQKAFIDTLIETTVYHGQRIIEFEERIAIQERRADQLECRADELSQQIEWIRQLIFINDGPRLDDFIC